MRISKKQRRRLNFKYALAHRDLLKKAIDQFRDSLYEKIRLKRGSVQNLPISTLLHSNTDLKLSNFNGRNGNVSYLELLVISSLIAQEKPMNLLEIGTFDGNTTLQMALNSPENATVHTLDLAEPKAALPLVEGDMLYIHDQQKKFRKFLDTSVQEKVIQHLGDSGVYDFSNFTQKGNIDFCFIDGSHSYESVKNDTEKTLEILSDNGWILWHDFTLAWPGVFQFLHEQAKTLPLFHIEGTTLVLYSARPLNIKSQS